MEDKEEHAKLLFLETLVVSIYMILWFFIALWQKRNDFAEAIKMTASAMN